MDGFEIGEGRTRLRLEWVWRGADLYVHIGGGRAHIGAVAMIGSDDSGKVLEHIAVVLPHKEGEMVLAAARRLHSELGGVVCVSGGVHLDDITREEIDAVLKGAEEGIARLSRELRSAGG